MNAAAPIRLLLGPQRPTANLGDAIAASGIADGRFAVISAGWQEAEGDIDDVRALVARELVDIGLYARTEAVMNADSELHDAYRRRQQQLIELQRLYRLRLRQLMIAARNVLRADGEPDFLLPEQRHAVAQLRALDRHHLHRVQAIHGAFEARFNRENYEELARHRAAMADVIASCQAVLITGGNVVVLWNRLRLFGFTDLLYDRHVVAWSAGAMSLAGRIVLFHDRTPQGRRDPELLGAGLGLIPGYLILPDASRRLRTKDTARTGLLARRFAPETCVTMDSGAALRLVGGRPAAVTEARRLTPKGSFAKVRVS